MGDPWSLMGRVGTIFIYSTRMQNDSFCLLFLAWTTLKKKKKERKSPGKQAEQARILLSPLLQWRVAWVLRSRLCCSRTWCSVNVPSPPSLNPSGPRCLCPRRQALSWQSLPEPWKLHIYLPGLSSWIIDRPTLPESGPAAPAQQWLSFTCLEMTGNGNSMYKQICVLKGIYSKILLNISKYFQVIFGPF